GSNALVEATPWSAAIARFVQRVLCTRARSRDSWRFISNFRSPHSRRIAAFRWRPMLLRVPSSLAGSLRALIALAAVTIATETRTAQAEEIATVAAGCKLATIGTGTVVAVRDGLTLALEDGRDIHLSGIE